MRRLQKTIEEIGWTKAVPRFGARDPVARAFDAMSRESHDCVLIVEGHLLVGIFTSRDFLNRVAALRRDPREVLLGDAMTPAPKTLRPRDAVVFAINWMALEGFRNVPVVDDDGRVQGVLTVWDVMGHIATLFDEIDATPRAVSPESDISGVVAVELGGDA
jgi:CBS domain-containing protein